MTIHANKRIKLGLLLVLLLLALGGLMAAGGQAQTASAAHLSTIVCTGGPTFNLETADDYAIFPDGNTIYFWGFADSDSGGNFQYPSPTLCVSEGDTVTVNLTNTLAEPVSIVFPGQVNVSATMTSGAGNNGLFTLEANPGETVQYSFTASQPGTYLYESGTAPHKQIQMGLFGALVVRPAMDTATEHFAYDDASTEYNPEFEYLLVLHDIDPDLHRAVELGTTYDVTTKHDRYWTINGRSNPDTLFGNGVPWLPNQPYGAMVTIREYDATDNPLPALIRYANAGMENHPFHPHGNHLRIIAQDGNLLQSASGEDLSFEGFTRTVGSGQTYDLLATWHNLGNGSLAAPNPFSPTSNPLPTHPENIPFPGLYNMVDFEDGFYSGSPYLGEQADRLVGSIPYNECGELYFPWHSHALNEIQNFDEGFGGMLTLWRIEPLDGCQ